jgi:hypothetical protein
VTPARTAFAIALAALASLLVPSLAGAAVWQGPVPISDAASTAGDTPRIAIGGSGDAAVAWWDSAAGGRILLARKRSGGAWSAPVSLGAAASPLTALTGVDGSGNVTAVWSTGGTTSVTTIATWPANSAAPSLATLDTSTLDMPEAATITDLVVNPAGVAVLAGESGTNNITLGYRATPTGPFAFSQKLGVGSTPARDPHIALNDAGSAVVIYRVSNTIWSSRLSAAVPSFGPADAVNAGIAGGTGPGDLSVAIDQSGNILVGFTLTETVGTSKAVGTAWRPPTGDWVAQWPLSPLGALTTFTASNTSIVVNRAGTAILAWRQQGATPLDNIISARVGASTTGAWAGIEAVNDVGAFPPYPAIGDDGTVVVAWEADVAAGQRVGRARVRTPAGAWGDTRALDTPHLADSEPLVSTDGHGHFATVTAPDAGGLKQVLLSFLDMVAPAITPVALAGTAQVGDPLAMSVTASDQWSTIPAVAWTFGDGTAGSGLAVAHAYASAGTYTANITVTDAAGNSASRQIAVTISALQSTLTTAKFSGKWKQSGIKGTLLVKGSIPRAGTYVVDVFKGKTRKVHASFTLGGGAFSKTIKLPAKLLPGSYHVALVPSFPATQVKPAGRDAKLAAPAEGVVDLVALSGANNGPPARTLRNATTIWASFRFAAVPRGSLTLTWYRTVNGKKQNLGSTTKAAARKVASYLRLGGTLHGRFTAVLARKGKVIAQGSVEAL